MAYPQTDVTTHIATLPGLEQLWSKTKGDPQICVAILDGPVDESHPSFQGINLKRVQTLISETASAGMMSSHGTHITSVIFGRHGSPVSGIAPGCRGLIVPVFSDNRGRKLSQLDLARAINQAVEAGANIINISGGELSQSGEAEPILANAVRACHENNVLIVAAAGNDGCECLHVPAALNSVLAVGAMNAQGLPFDFSNWGKTYQTQGILAPGEGILGAKPGGGTVTNSGTSFATPIVSGIAALLLDIQLQRGEKLNPYAVREAILKSALPCLPETEPESRRCLAGRLNILGAYNLILQGGQTIVPEEKSATQLSEFVSLNPSGLEAVTLPASETSEQPGPSTAGIEAAGMVATSESLPSTFQNSANVMTNMPNTSNAIASSVTPNSVQPSENCGCNGQVTPSASPSIPSVSLIYALGILGYDFGTEARRDSFKQLMPMVRSDNYEPVDPDEELPNDVFPIPANPYDARQMVKYLQNNASEAKSLIWTLNLELTPIYAIEPQGSFASDTYQYLVDLLAGQIIANTEDEYIERVSIPGVLTGKTVKLFSGQVVPTIEAISTRGMYGWKINALINSVIDAIDPDPDQNVNDETIKKIKDSLRNFLMRIYYDLRNLGQTSSERALNYSATNVFQYADALAQILKNENSGSQTILQLDSLSVEKSPFCRMDSDCWDVKIKFFDPENNRRARKVMRYTIDVSDMMPVTLGQPRIWSES